MSEISQGPGWWLAADGKWYRPELHPEFAPPGPPLLPAFRPHVGPPTAAWAEPSPRVIPSWGDPPAAIGWGNESAPAPNRYLVEPNSLPADTAVQRYVPRRRRRVGAYLLDSLIASIFGIVAAGLLGTHFGYAARPTMLKYMLGGFGATGEQLRAIFIASFVSWVPLILAEAFGGSLGKRALSLRTIRYKNGAKLGIGRAIVRVSIRTMWLSPQVFLVALGVRIPLLALLLLFLDLYPCFFTEERRALHDYMSRTMVVAA